MIEYNECDSCGIKEDTLKLIWIDTEDFKPLPKDDFNSIKHQEAIEIFNFSALCNDCYKNVCCGVLE